MIEQNGLDHRFGEVHKNHELPLAEIAWEENVNPGMDPRSPGDTKGGEFRTVKRHNRIHFLSQPGKTRRDEGYHAL
ncbi:hypothetical protein [Desulfoluna spongiiphila]|uniref:hypothetical protein n=1 Tax=Desulfoluna spongiiphila TaxID=419481 RepID=UPI0011136C99|nr:hypothetical protein [Desulfoluna spongiiphila]